MFVPFHFVCAGRTNKKEVWAKLNSGFSGKRRVGKSGRELAGIKIKSRS